MKVVNKKRPSIVISITTILSMVYIIGVTQTSTLFRENKNEPVTAEETAGNLLNEDPWTEINKIADKYINNNQLSISGNIKLYEYETSKIIEEQKFSYVRSGDNMAYSIGSVEMAADKEYSVVVDNTQKIMAITKLENNPLAEKAFDIEKLKKLMSEQKASAKVLQNKDQNIIVVDNINYDDIASYKLYYSPKSYQVIKIVLVMSSPFQLDDNDKPTVSNDINKSDKQNTDTGIDTSAVDQLLIPGVNLYTVEINYANEKVYQENTDHVKRYVVFRNKNIYTTEQYKNYELLNQITKHSAASDEGE
jgi:hypothetical protein